MPRLGKGVRNEMARATNDSNKVFGELEEEIRPRLSDLAGRLESAKEYL
jgi:hypothetical protein